MPRAINGFKVCSNKKCYYKGQPQSIINFNKESRRTDKLALWCKDCSSDWAKEYRQTLEGKANLKNSRRKHFEKPEARQKHRQYQRLKLFKISKEEELLLSQQTNCECCGEPFSNENNRLQCIDHFHNGSYGIRGVLCNQCNKGIGMFKEDPKILYRAASYLENKLK